MKYLTTEVLYRNGWKKMKSTSGLKYTLWHKNSLRMGCKITPTGWKPIHMYTVHKLGCKLLFVHGTLRFKVE